MGEKLLIATIVLLISLVIYLLAPSGSDTPSYWGLPNNPPHCTADPSVPCTYTGP